MQLVINVKDNYVKKVVNILDNLKDVMIDDIKIKNQNKKKLKTFKLYQDLSKKEKKEVRKEIKYIKKASKTVKLIKSGKIKTYPIEELWDKLDD